MAALAADLDVVARRGQVLRVADLASTYGFTDIDFRHVPAFELAAGPDEGHPKNSTSV